MSDEIPPGPLTGFQPLYCVLAKLNTTLDGFDNSISGVYPWTGAASDFAKSIRDKTVNPNARRFYLPIINGTAFAIWGHCYIFFVMPDQGYFANNGTGVRLEPKDTANRYVDLYELPDYANSEPVKGTDVAANGVSCAVAYFSAKTDPFVTVTQKFSIIKDDSNPSGPFHGLLVVDPDVKNDGTSPQWP